jgi:hypothetical protein
VRLKKAADQYIIGTKMKHGGIQNGIDIYESGDAISSADFLYAAAYFVWLRHISFNVSSQL